MDFFKNRIYLDYISSTPLDNEMLSTFPALSSEAISANPSALHKEGQQAKKALANARHIAAAALGAHDDEIIFTGNATESDNMALQGTVRAFLKKGVSPEQIAVIASDIEHAAVLETVQALNEQIETIILPTEQGILDPKSIVVPDDISVAIVSVMYVNNEIGTVQAIADIAKRVRFLRKNIPNLTILLHIDATQAPLIYSLNVQKLGIDLMTLGATKLYCPKGAGLLYVKRDTAIAPILFGGGQEFGLRPGTQPVQLIHDFAYALQYAQQHIEQFSEKTKKLQEQFETTIKKNIPQAIITAEALPRSPHVSHIAIKGFDSELLVLELDARGVAVSAKSACKNDVSRTGREEADESGIVERIYGKGWGAVRFSFGRMTASDDIEKAIAAFDAVLEKYA